MTTNSPVAVLLPVVFCLLVALVRTSLPEPCPPVTLSEGSPLYPQRTKGGNVTMYRVFLTVGNPPLVNITWVREPSSLSLSKDRYVINNTLSNGAVRASIKLWDLMLFPDLGSYTVTVCSNCTCNKTTFFLTLFQCDPRTLPQPVEQYLNFNFHVPSSEVLYIYSVFNGSNSTFFYPTVWTYKDKNLCFEGMEIRSATFSCNRTFLGNCMFSANLYIYGYTLKNSGNYTVQAVGSGSASRNSTVHVNIMKEPQLHSCKLTKPIPRYYQSGNSRFHCHLSNYSDYVHVVVMEKNGREYNESTEGVTFGCEAQVSDRSLATCTVSIFSSGHSGKTQFRLCAGYNSSVVTHTTQLQCSEDIITIVPDDCSQVTLGKIVEASVVVMLVVLILVLSARAIVRIDRKGRADSYCDGLGGGVMTISSHGGLSHNGSPEGVKCTGQQIYGHTELLRQGYFPGLSPKLSESSLKNSSPKFSKSHAKDCEEWEIVALLEQAHTVSSLQTQYSDSQRLSEAATITTDPEEQIEQQHATVHTSPHVRVTADKVNFALTQYLA